MDARYLIAPHTAACLAADPCPHDAAEAAASQARRATADEHIAHLARRSRAMEREGDYRAAQEASDEAAEWGFWATYGCTPAQWDAAQQD